MLLKTILNSVTNYKSFRFGNVSFEQKGTDEQHIVAMIHPRKNGKAVCSECGKPCPTYDTARETRRFEFVPLWNIVTTTFVTITFCVFAAGFSVKVVMRVLSFHFAKCSPAAVLAATRTATMEIIIKNTLTRKAGMGCHWCTNTKEQQETRYLTTFSMSRWASSSTASESLTVLHP